MKIFEKIKNRARVFSLVMLITTSVQADCPARPGPEACTELKVFSKKYDKAEEVCNVTYEEVESKRQWSVLLKECPLVNKDSEKFVYKIEFFCNDMLYPKREALDSIEFLTSTECKNKPKENHKKVLNLIKSIPVGFPEKDLKNKYKFRALYPVLLYKNEQVVQYHSYPGVVIEVSLRKKCETCKEYVVAKKIENSSVSKIFFSERECTSTGGVVVKDQEQKIIDCL